MKHSLEFIVLSTTKVGDSSLVIHTLSREFGRRSFIAKVRGGSSMALFLPLNILSGEVLENPKSDLWRISAMRAEYPLGGIRNNIHKNTMTLFLSEVLFRVLRDGVYEDGLYDWCKGQILMLDSLPSDFANFHLRFLLELCGALGFSPSVEDLMPFAGERMEQIQSLLTLPVGESLLLPLSGAHRNEIAAILLEYLGYHIESRLTVRSLGVLRELYS